MPIQNSTNIETKMSDFKCFIAKNLAKIDKISNIKNSDVSMKCSDVKITRIRNKSFLHHW